MGSGVQPLKITIGYSAGFQLRRHDTLPLLDRAWGASSEAYRFPTVNHLQDRSSRFNSSGGPTSGEVGGSGEWLGKKACYARLTERQNWSLLWQADRTAS